MAIAEVSDELGNSLGRRIAPTFGYYRQPNGWITISPNTRLERLKYTEDGWTYLEQYGAFDMSPYVVNHPFEGLFMMGGAKEMPVDQVLETGIAIDAPLVPRCRQHLTQYHRVHTKECWAGAQKVEFPQLAGLSAEVVGPFKCDFCGRKMPTKQALGQHQGVAHAKPRENIQLGETLGAAMATAIGRVAAPPVTSAETEAMIDAGLSVAQLRRLAELEAADEKRRAKNRGYRRKAKASTAA